MARLLAGEKTLVIGRAAQLRKWVAARLGQGPPPPPGRRPPTDLSGVATEVQWLQTAGEFPQLVIYERLMGRSPAPRPDLKPPAWLALDLEARFPRLEVLPRLPPGAAAYGPFKGRARAEAARTAVHRRVALRPCDFAFEPASDLPLGLGCLYAQVRSCAAPCLQRISGSAYRELAHVAAALLDGGDGIPEIPPHVSAPGTRAVVAEMVGADLVLYPLAGWTVLDGQMARVPLDVAAVAEALHRVDWPPPGAGPDDSPWLSAWLHAPRRRGIHTRLQGAGDAERIVSHIGSRTGAR